MTKMPNLIKMLGQPVSNIHLAMKRWANENKQPDLYMVTTFKDGSTLSETCKPYSKLVEYKVNGSKYFVSVDVKGQWIYKFGETTEILTRKGCVSLQREYCLDYLNVKSYVD